MNENTAYAEAESFFASGQYGQAKIKYLEALLDARDPIQESQIEFKIALSAEKSGDYPDAITRYKMIIGKATSYRFTRAASAQQLMLMVMEPAAQRYLPLISADAPYSEIVVAGDREMTKKNMAEYASSFYPLALPELIAATWYGQQLLTAVREGGMSTSTALQYGEKIRQKVENVEKDIVRIQNDPNERRLIPDVMNRKAILYGLLTGLRQVSIDNARAAFETAIQMNAVNGPGQDGFSRYFYAFFISQVPTLGSSDIQAVLRPVYTDPAYVGSPVVTFFMGEKNNALRQKANITAVAQKDADFKAFLMTIGWTGADFER
ncbi:MAG: hypothetical protein KGZ69_15645 [Methylomonas sp.]|nr:hypothetical protein [Methylomonas sp.]